MGLVPIIQPKSDLSWKCSFCAVLDNNELIMFIKCQKILMTGYRGMDKPQQKSPKMEVFPIFVIPKFFFKNWTLSLLYPYGASTSCTKVGIWVIFDVFCPYLCIQSLKVSEI